MTAARRLAAILAADVVGYSRLMGAGDGLPVRKGPRQHRRLLRLKAKVFRLARSGEARTHTTGSDNRLDALATDDVKQGERRASGTFRATLQL